MNNGQSSRHQGTLPVRVTDGAWFHLRYGAIKGNAVQEDAFIVQTFSDLRTLIARANDAGAVPVLYICSKALEGNMAFRRVVALRKVHETDDMHVFELEDGQAVLWDEGSDVELSTCIQIDAPSHIGGLANISSPRTNPDSTEREQNVGIGIASSQVQCELGPPTSAGDDMVVRETYDRGQKHSN